MVQRRKARQWQLEEHSNSINFTFSQGVKQMVGSSSGILSRLSRLVSANINDLISRAENPEIMLDQFLREMEQNIAQARNQVVEMIAQEQLLKEDLRETTGLAGEWQNKAQKAIAAGKDDLAREAIRRKGDNERDAKVYGDQLATQREVVQRLKSQLTQLESKYQQTLSQRDSLIARQRAAKAQIKVSESFATITPLDPANELDHMERKIRSDEARAAALTELSASTFDAQFQELEYDDEVESQLAALKAGMMPSLESGDEAQSQTAPSGQQESPSG